MDHDQAGFKFLILDGGMEVNIRPALYGSQHPFYVISKDTKEIISDEFVLNKIQMQDGKKEDLKNHKYIVVGKCCETGDAQTISKSSDEEITSRTFMDDPKVGDIFIIGGAGAYCSSMTPFNYNSHLQSAEVLIKSNEEMSLIRKKQTMEQLVANELNLEDNLR